MAIPYWEAIDVTSSRRPVLSYKEEVLFVQSQVGLYDGSSKALEYQHGSVYLTTHRICYVDAEKPSLRSIALTLESIDRIEHNAGFLRSNPKVKIKYKSDTNSSGDVSGRSTPFQPIMVPAKQKSAADWVCPICTFTNVVQPGHIPGSPLPACVNCGMKPPKSTKISHVISNPLPTTQVSVSRLNEGASKSTPYASTVPDKIPVSKARTSNATFPCPRCTFGNHPAITNCELCGAPLLSRNLPPVLNSNTVKDNLSSTVSSVNGNSQVDSLSCKLSFRAGGDKQFFDRMRRAVADSSWQKVSDKMEEIDIQTSDLTPKRGAGIGGLQNREEVIRTKDANIMSGAFEDLEGLMARAKDMIALAESFAKRISAAPASAGLLEAQALIAESSAAIGLTSPVVVRDATGKSNVFHSELARQISDFLENGNLKKEGGVMTLADLFATYNRARKGNLISPEDLLLACQQLDTLRLPIRLRKFKSGIVVVQDRYKDDNATRRAVLTWLRARTIGISALDATEYFGWSIGIAMDELEMVEEHGDIVRDVSVEGIQFFQNTMKGWDWREWYATHTEST